MSGRAIPSVALCALLLASACSPAAPAQPSNPPAGGQPAAASTATAVPASSNANVPAPQPGPTQAISNEAATPEPQQEQSGPGIPEDAPMPAIPQITMGLPGDFVNPSPFFAFSTQDKNLLNHVVPGLTRIGLNNELLPMLALSWKQLDPLTWQFKLRPNVKFHNGEPFTADAFKANFDVMFDPATKASQKTNFELIKKIDIVDPLTLNLTLSSPSPIMPRQLSDFHILAPQELKQDGFQTAGKKMIGTGPYKLVEWVKGDHLTLEANPDYWGGKPAIEKLVFRPIPEDGARVAALQTGEIDIASNVPTEMANTIGSKGQTRAEQVITRVVYLLGMNQLDQTLPTYKKEVRQAISYAIDRAGIVKNIMGGAGAPLATLFHNTQFGRDTSLKPRPYDPQKAKELLAQAGYPNGFSIHMVAPQNGRWPKSEEVAQAIASELGDVGINVDLQLLEYTAFTEAVHTHKQPLALWGWGDATGDPATMLLRIFTCPSRGSPWSMNCIPQMDQLAWDEQSEVDTDKRIQELHQLQQMMYDEETDTGIFQIGNFVGVGPKAVDWYSPRTDEGFWFFHPVKS